MSTVLGWLSLDGKLTCGPPSGLPLSSGPKELRHMGTVYSWNRNNTESAGRHLWRLHPGYSGRPGGSELRQWQNQRPPHSRILQNQTKLFHQDSDSQYTCLGQIHTDTHAHNTFSHNHIHSHILLMLTHESITRLLWELNKIIVMTPLGKLQWAINSKVLFLLCTMASVSCWSYFFQRLLNTLELLLPLLSNRKFSKTNIFLSIRISIILANLNFIRKKLFTVIWERSKIVNSRYSK